MSRKRGSYLAMPVLQRSFSSRRSKLDCNLLNMEGIEKLKVGRGEGKEASRTAVERPQERPG